MFYYVFTIVLLEFTTFHLLLFTTILLSNTTNLLFVRLNSIDDLLLIYQLLLEILGFFTTFLLCFTIIYYIITIIYSVFTGSKKIYYDLLLFNLLNLRSKF